MEGRIVVITIDIMSSAKKILADLPAMDLRDVRCARHIKKMFFLGWGNHSQFIG
jgi:hypothetical protein